MSIDTLKRRFIIEQTIQRNELVKNWIDKELESPIEQAGAWKLFRFLCEHYPQLRGGVIFHSSQED